MTPFSVSVGQLASRSSSSSAISSARPGWISPARSRQVANSVFQPASDRSLGRDMAKSAPARCISATARPSAAQCSVVTRLGHMPLRKLTIAAGRPHSSRSASPVASRIGTGQAMPRAAKWSISPRKNGRSSRATRFS
jgi:hypothetical protein